MMCDNNKFIRSHDIQRIIDIMDENDISSNISTKIRLDDVWDAYYDHQHHNEN